MTAPLQDRVNKALAVEAAKPFACETCGLGYDMWQVECDDYGGPVEERPPPEET